MRNAPEAVVAMVRAFVVTVLLANAPVSGALTQSAAIVQSTVDRELVNAAERNDLTAVSTLLDRGADASARIQTAGSALTFAIYSKFAIRWTHALHV